MINFPCICGQRLQVAAELAGCRVRCPVCQQVARAPLESPAPGSNPPGPDDDLPTIASSHDQTVKPPKPAPKPDK